MATRTCWRCLSRPSPKVRDAGVSSITTQLAAFTTSTPSAATAAVKPGSGKAAKPSLGRTPPSSKKTLRLKKKAPPAKGRPPAPGERKAARKRIVLSNTNAIEVQSMKDMTAELLMQEETIGRVLGVPGTVVDQLRAVEAFKITQGWGLFRRPGMLVRDETVRFAKILAENQREGKTSMHALEGPRGAGKSMSIVQALATAALNNWVIINIPEAQDLTIAMTDYAPLPDTNPVQYSQNTYTATLLSQIQQANNAYLSKLPLTLPHDLPVPIAAKSTVAQLCELATREVDAAWPIFLAVWAELTAPNRRPILFALDGLAHIMGYSKYRSADFKPIHAHDLALVRFYLDHLSGTLTLPNGGAVLAATSYGNSPASYALDLALSQKRAVAAGLPPTPRDPYKALDDRGFAALQAAQLLELKGLSQMEARGLMEYWARSGVLRQRVDEAAVREKWTLAGRGIVGEIARNALWMRI